MKQLPPQTWTFNGHRFSVTLFVEGNTVVGMSEVTTEAGIVVTPTAKLLGDHVANGLAKLGAKPCNGCKKRQSLLNRAHRGARRLVGMNA